MKKVISLAVVAILMAAMFLTLVGCNDKDDISEIQLLREQLKDMSDKLSAMEQQGAQGTPGANGETPYIGTNGNWWIGTTDTGVKAQGQQGEQGQQGIPGKDGNTPYIGANGNWHIGTTDTGVKAQGQQGEQGRQGTSGKDGNTPYIGTNGNWYIGTTDTNIKAQGQQGEKGDTGAQGPQGEQGIQGPQGMPGADGNTPYIGTNGNWWIDSTDTGVKAVRDEDIANLDNLIASNIYMLKKEFGLGQQVDIYCNGEVILSLLLECIQSAGSAVRIDWIVTYSKYLQYKVKILEMLRIVSVEVDASTGLAQYAFLSYNYNMGPKETELFQPGNQETSGCSFFSNGECVTNANYFNIFVAIPGTNIPMSSFNNILKSDLPMYMQ